MALYRDNATLLFEFIVYGVQLRVKVFKGEKNYCLNGAKIEIEFKVQLGFN